MEEIKTQRVRVPSCGGELAVHVAGRRDAPVVLLNHSILSSTWMWRSQMEALVLHGFRAVSVDARGHGASDAPADTRCTPDDLAADNIAVMDALDIERAHFLGLSLGGMVGLGMGIGHPQRMGTLVLCDMRADCPPDFAAAWDERIAIARQHGTRPLAPPTAERWFGADFLNERPEVAQGVLDMIAATSVDGFVACARAIQALDYLQGCGSIRSRVRMIVGDADGVLPDVMGGLRDRIPGATLEVVTGAGHLPNIQQPGAFTDALLRALQH